MLSLATVLAALSASASLILAAPAQAPPAGQSLTPPVNPPPKPAHVCSGDPGGVYDPSCWDSLNLGQWLQDWQRKTPKCDQNSDSDGQDCCNPANSPDETWSKCFLRHAVSDADYECDSINANSCALNGFRLNDTILHSPEAAQYRYVVRNIYVINNLLQTWYTAIQYAIQNAEGWSADIIQYLDPEKKTNVLSTILLAVFSGLFMFLTMGAAVEMFAAAVIATTASTVAKVAEKAATTSTKTAVEAGLLAFASAPSVARTMWPTGTIDSKFYQLGELNKAVSEMQANISASTSEALGVLMSDVTSFTNFAKSGAFSNSSVLSIEKTTAELRIGFRMFVLTSVMRQNNWRASWYQLPGPVRNKMADTSQSSQENVFRCKMDNTGICTGKGPEGVGNGAAWSEWTSPTTKRAWTLDQKNHLNTVSSSDMTHHIVNNQWAPLELLFDGAFNCAAKAGSRNNDMSPVIMNPDGTWDLDCMSQIPVSIGCNQPCPVQPTNGKCNFEIWDGCPK